MSTPPLRRAAHSPETDSPALRTSPSPCPFAAPLRPALRQRSAPGLARSASLARLSVYSAWLLVSLSARALWPVFALGPSDLAMLRVPRFGSGAFSSPRRCPDCSVPRFRDSINHLPGVTRSLYLFLASTVRSALESARSLSPYSFPFCLHRCESWVSRSRCAAVPPKIPTLVLCFCDSLRKA